MLGRLQESLTWKIVNSSAWLGSGHRQGSGKVWVLSMMGDILPLNSPLTTSPFQFLEKQMPQEWFVFNPPAAPLLPLRSSPALNHSEFTPCPHTWTPSCAGTCAQGLPPAAGACRLGRGPFTALVNPEQQVLQRAREKQVGTSPLPTRLETNKGMVRAQSNNPNPTAALAEKASKSLQF